MTSLRRAIQVPSHLHFSDLNVRLTTPTDISLSGDVMAQVLEHNGLDASEKSTVVDVVYAWYQWHRAKGGAPDEAVEVWLRVAGFGVGVH